MPVRFRLRMKWAAKLSYNGTRGGAGLVKRMGKQLEPDKTLLALAGGQALADWFGRVPRFHDAEILDLGLDMSRGASLRLHAWNLTRLTNEAGVFLTDKNAVISILFSDVRMVSLADLNLLPAIVYELSVSKSEEGIRVEWSSSYGVYGYIVAAEVRFELTPGAP